jgi:glycine/D-amino acid oxidase-like deaminating enzyme
MNLNQFTSDSRTSPYWWDDAPLVQVADTNLPEAIDVLIVGAGYTGLHAALQTTRAGLSTLVLDAEAPGYGCSTRNGGHISTSVKASYPALAKRYSEDIASELLQAGKDSLEYIKAFVADEHIDCDFYTSGRFHGAHTPQAFDKLVKELKTPNPVYDSEAYIVSPRDAISEVSTAYYHGGVVYPQFGAIHPAKYFAGVLERVKTAGAQVIGHCSVLSIEPEPTQTHRDRQFQVHTAQGVVRAKKVFIATNGYTGSLNPWQQRRIIPIGSYMIATEAMNPDTVKALFPTQRMVTDTRRLVVYYRASPDGTRVVFGGRVSLNETNPYISGPKLLAEVVRIFPELKGIRISHSWFGKVAYTFDTLMHCGQENGVHYAMGYCGSGVGMASYLGMRLGQQLAETHTADVPFAKIPFPTRPLYRGNPWFLAPSVLWYQLRDRTGL